MCTHHDSGYAKSTLQAATCGERFGERLTDRRLEAFEGHDGSSVDFVEWGLTTHDGLAVHEHRATAALAAGGTAVLRGGDVELLAQGGEEVGMGRANGHGRPVHDKADDPLVCPQRHGFTLQGKENAFTVC